MSDNQLQTLAHEIGHNLNMRHTFDIDYYYPKPELKIPCNYIGGIMDYDGNNGHLSPVSN